MDPLIKSYTLALYLQAAYSVVYRMHFIGFRCFPNCRSLMAKSSPHRLKGKIVRIRRGLALYQTHASPFYFARILDPRTHRYKVRSTKETNRIDARRAAEELAAKICAPDAPADA